MRRGIILFLTFAYFCVLPLRLIRSAPAVADFDLQGIAVFQCQCTAHACPCQKNGAPTHGTCESADFVHIVTGRYGNVRLDGLNAAIVGNLVDQNKARLYATIYIDQKANPTQREALTAIEQFLNGAYETSPLRASKIQSVPIAFSESSDKTTYSMMIPEILQERTRWTVGQT